MASSGTASSMANDNERLITDDRDAVLTERPVVTTTPDAAYRPIVTPTNTVVERPSRSPAFLAGFVTAVVVAAVAFAVFLVVSDSDNDGNINVDVPAVEVDTGG